jgi:hypothetical protein
MRNLLAFLAAAGLTFAGLGWYLDWYKIRSSPTPAGRQSINIDINSHKIGEDIHQGVRIGEDKLRGLDKDHHDSNTFDEAPKSAVGHHDVSSPSHAGFEEEQELHFSPSDSRKPQ